MIERQAHAGVYDCMDELSASQIRALSEMLAAHSRDDLEWRKRNDETLRKHLDKARQRIAESRELLSQIDEAL
jgi:hypothetical protein